MMQLLSGGFRVIKNDFENNVLLNLPYQMILCTTEATYHFKPSKRLNFFPLQLQEKVMLQNKLENLSKFPNSEFSHAYEVL